MNTIFYLELDFGVVQIYEMSEPCTTSGDRKPINQVHCKKKSFSKSVKKIVKVTYLGTPHPTVNGRPLRNLIFRDNF